MQVRSAATSALAPDDGTSNDCESDDGNLQLIHAHNMIYSDNIICSINKNTGMYIYSYTCSCWKFYKARMAQECPPEHPMHAHLNQEWYSSFCPGAVLAITSMWPCMHSFLSCRLRIAIAIELISKTA